MIWTFLILIVGFVIYKFFTSLDQDKDDLNNQILSEKFRVIVNMLNDDAFGGKGNIVVQDNRNFNLWEENSNQIIFFQYSTGSLTIEWKYKYYQKEVVYKRNFPDSRNLSIFEQKKIAEVVISQMRELVKKHKSEVLGIDNKLQEEQLIKSKKFQEERLRSKLNDYIWFYIYDGSSYWENASRSERVKFIDRRKEECFKEVNIYNVKREFEEEEGVFYFSQSEYEAILRESILNFVDIN